MARISNTNSGLAGEYFVAAELYRRGWTVGMTIGNAKAVDLFAEKDNKRIAVEVKAIYRKKSICWTVMKEKVRLDCYYILVNLNADKMELPDYYIFTSSEVKRKIKQYKNRDIVNLSEVNSNVYKNNWEKLEKK